MTGLDGEINTDVENSTTAICELFGPQRLVLGPYGSFGYRIPLH